ncbi:MAG: XRE family transcriptional regulator [Anaerolineae bacterium]|nr:XRE family transcriptional regulator [Anaerolineae bacterium]
MEFRGLGQVIRTLRLQRQVTGSELARRCNVTRGLISQIERGSTVPSLDVLVRIANALEVPVGQLLDSSTAQPNQGVSDVAALDYDPVVRRKERRRITFPKENQVYESLTPTLSGQLEFSILRIGPLALENSPVYSHPGEEALLVLEGQLTVYLNDIPYHLEKGDSMYYPATIPHRYVCTGNKPAVVVMAETPVAFFNVLTRHLSIGNHFNHSQEGKKERRLEDDSETGD